MYLAITRIKKNPPHMMCLLYLSAVFVLTIFAECSYLFNFGVNSGEATPCIRKENTLLHPRDAIEYLFFLIKGRTAGQHFAESKVRIVIKFQLQYYKWTLKSLTLTEKEKETPTKTNAEIGCTGPIPGTLPQCKVSTLNFFQFLLAILI